jgi:glycosyltransferase involved in cell wall biosynthesis
MKMSLRVSLIVVAEPDDNDHRQQNFFGSVAGQTYPHELLQLILVDGCSKASTAAALDAFRLQHPALSACLLHCESDARAARNNLAATRAGGELLIFLADDFDPAPDLVAAHAAYHLLNPDLDAVGIGPGLFPDDVRRDAFARWLEDSGQIFGVPMRRTVPAWQRTFFYIANASIKKAKFDALGGFDEQFPYPAWDDYEFALRWVASGGYSQFIAGAIATHRHRVTFEERCAAMVRAGESARVLERLHPDAVHRWREKLRTDARPACPTPAEDAPVHAWIAFFNERLDAEFRRGYLSGR